MRLPLFHLIISKPGQKKPYSAISVQVERLTSETYEEDDVAGIPDLIEVIKLQDTGPTEAARALRKKLKYGSVHRQLRALAILDGLVQNTGSRFQKSIFRDEPLLERLRIAASDPLGDAEVRKKCKILFAQWAAGLKSEPGLEGAAMLYQQLPKTRKSNTDASARQRSKVLRETEEQARQDSAADEPPAGIGIGPSSPRTSVSRPAVQPGLLSAGPNLVTKSKKSKKNKNKAFSLDREKPQLLQTIASSQVASTNLMNALKLVNREDRRVSEDSEVMSRFETCKQLRRQILRYIQYVESDDFLGGLIHANEELVAALMAFEVLDKSVDDDSDSEMEEAAHLSRAAAAGRERGEAEKGRDGGKLSTSEGNAGISLEKKVERRPEPESESESEEDDDDEDNPFGDRNAAATPMMETSGFTWKEV